MVTDPRILGTLGLIERRLGEIEKQLGRLAAVAEKVTAFTAEQPIDDEPRLIVPEHGDELGPE